MCLKARMASKLIAKLKDSEVRTKLLKHVEEDFSLENIVAIFQTEENSKKNERKIANMSIVN